MLDTGVVVFDIPSNKDCLMEMGICALCLEEEALRDSHLMPQALYKKLWSGEKKASLVSIKKGSSFYDSKQVRQYLLCEKCEQKFSRPYERTVINQSASYNSFGLAEITRPLKKIEGNFLAFPDKELCEVYYYFACSILWRAMNSGWRGFEMIKPRSMPEDFYFSLKEKLRLYLDGKAEKPESIVVTVHVDKSTKPYKIINFPNVDYFNNDFHCDFSIPGSIFHIMCLQDATLINTSDILREDKILFTRHTLAKHLSFIGMCSILSTATPKGRLAKET